MFQKNQLRGKRILPRLLPRRDRPSIRLEASKKFIIFLKKDLLLIGSQLRLILAKNMSLSKIISPYYRHTLERFHQGDILRDILAVLWAFKKEEEGATPKIEVRKRVLEYGIVLTQECDLEQDINNRRDCKDHSDKFIDSILLIPAYPADKLKQGTHIEGSKKQNFGTKLWTQVKENHDYRYHYLTEYLDFQLPSLVADFKHYFTIPRDVLYETYKSKGHYIASLEVLFRENLSVRFTQYLARIGLPEIIVSPSVNPPVQHS